MAQFFHRGFPTTQRRFTISLFCALWISGLLTGSLLFLNSQSLDFTLMRGALLRPVSIVSSMIVTVFPFLISAIAVSFSSPRLLCVFAFFKGLLVSFSALVVSAAFGTAGWLMRCMVMFSDFWSLIWLMAFWLRTVAGQGDTSMRGAARYLLPALAGTFAVVFWLSPFLSRL